MHEHAAWSRRLLCLCACTLAAAPWLPVCQGTGGLAGSIHHGGSAGNLPWVEQLSWTPRVYVYHNFLSADECSHIIAKARPQMRKSTVQGDAGTSVLDSIRTSYGTFLRRNATPTIAAIERRIASWTHLDVPYQEDLQILRYGIGQKYGAHYDSIADGSPRVATVLLYLSNHTLEGGETAFPLSKRQDPVLEDGFSDCARGRLAFQPKQGVALLFYSLGLDQKHDDQSMHTGCPVISGIKWTATKWIHTKPFHPEWLDGPIDTFSDPGECIDEDVRCAKWVQEGECEKNPNFMTGDTGLAVGACRRSCKTCEACQPGDHACRQRNREQAGFLLDDQE